MWHEARKQERLVRNQMVDSAKRSERRKIFYESIRREPEEFMQIHGRKCVIHMDANVATAAESSNILRKWQGDSNVLIDRFDVRSHLDHISEVRESSDPETLKDNVQELQCEYERYRILVFNEYSKISERTCLSRISSKEFWPSSNPSIHRREAEKKKKLIEKKAAIGFSYADSETVSNNSGGGGSYAPRSNKAYESGDSGDDSSDMDEIDDIKDVQFNVDELTPEQGAQLNKLGAHYNIGAGVFLKLFRLDCKEMHNNAEIKEIDKAKLALSGRQAKADRAVLKRRRALIVGKVTQNEEATTTLLSFLANKRGVASQELDSSSESGGEVPEKTEFITSFGGDDDEKDDNNVGIVFGRAKNTPFSKAVYQRGRTNGGSSVNTDDGDDSIGPSVVVQGPVLPTKEYRRLLELKRRRSTSLDAFKDVSGRRSNSKSPTALRFTSTRKRPSSRSRSPRDRRRSRSTSYRRYHDSGRRGWSDRERKRRRRHSSSSSRSSSPLSSSGSNRRQRRQPRTNHTDKNQSSNSNSNNGKSASRVCQSNDSRSSSAAGSARSNSDSGPDSPLSIHSSMSEEEREQREIENRKRRIRRVKRDVRQQRRSTLSAQDPSKEADEKKKTDLAKKLRQQMHKSLKKTAEQLKQEEAERIREQMRERKQREDELLEEARLLRMKEREKRKQEEEEEKERRKRERQERHSIDAISAAVSGRAEDVQQRRSSTSSRRRRSRSGSRCGGARSSSSAHPPPYYRSGESTLSSRNCGGEGSSRR